MDPGGAKSAPSWPQDGPKSCQERPKSRPQAVVERPGRPPGAHLAPKSPPEASRRPFYPPRGSILVSPGLLFCPFRRAKKEARGRAKPSARARARARDVLFLSRFLPAATCPSVATREEYALLRVASPFALLRFASLCFAAEHLELVLRTSARTSAKD